MLNSLQNLSYDAWMVLPVHRKVDMKYRPKDPALVQRTPNHPSLIFFAMRGPLPPPLTPPHPLHQPPSPSSTTPYHPPPQIRDRLKQHLIIILPQGALREIRNRRQRFHTGLIREERERGLAFRVRGRERAVDEVGSDGFGGAEGGLDD